jgi:hypothetical protein
MDSGNSDQELSTEIRKLEDRLSDLAAEYRGMPGDRQRIKEEYHSTMKKLLSLGWDDFLDFESFLPTTDMPPEYMSRHPFISSNRWGSVSFGRKKTQE